MKASDCCNASVLTALSTALEGQTNWYICSECGQPCNVNPNVNKK